MVDLVNAVNLLLKTFSLAVQGLVAIFQFGLEKIGLPITGYIGIVAILVLIYIFFHSWKAVAVAFAILVVLGFLKIGLT